VVGAALVVRAATVRRDAEFLIAKTALGDPLRARAALVREKEGAAAALVALAILTLAPAAYRKCRARRAAIT
jgi:hypothetical protein